MGRSLERGPGLLRRRALGRAASSEVSSRELAASSASPRDEAVERPHRHAAARHVPPRGRRGGRARDLRAPGRRRGSSPTTASRHLPRPPAARGRSTRPTCSSCRRASSTSDGRGAAGDAPSASWPRRSARPPPTGSTWLSYCSSPGFTDEQVHVFLGHRPDATSSSPESRRGRAHRASSAGRSPTSTA